MRDLLSQLCSQQLATRGTFDRSFIWGHWLNRLAKLGMELLNKE